MGCAFGKHCDPGVPDPSVRYRWHIDGIIIDDGEHSEIGRGGLVFIQDEAICYKPRRFDCSKQGIAQSIDIVSVCNTTQGKTYTEEQTHREIKKNIIWIESNEGEKNKTIGLLTTRDNDSIYKELCEVISKHRQRPKIVQYNSIDIDGVEIEPI